VRINRGTYRRANLTMQINVTIAADLDRSGY
jgi:hypothetical protein